MAIIDYSTARPTIAELRLVGVTAVGRYIGWDSVPGYTSIGKNITKSEADSLISAGIEIFLAFEYNANAAALGTTQGHRDAILAKQQLAQIGAPPSMTVYFAVDFDIPDYAPGIPDTPANAMAKLGPVGLYFAAIKELKESYEVGGYGSYYAIKRLFDAGLITKGWQATAWSGGQIENRAVLYQVVSTPPIVGVDINIREHMATEADYGQWPRPSDPAPAPKPKPVPTNMKGTSMLILKVTATAPNKFSDGKTGTRTFLYSPGSIPVWIVSGADQAAFGAVLNEVEITWAQYQEFLG